jgi:DNA topoisomerase-1
MTDTNLTAYCVKCKATRPVEEAQAVFMANGRPATRGVCPVCGTGLFKIGATEAHAGLPAPEVTKKSASGAGSTGAAGRRSRSAGSHPLARAPREALAAGAADGKRPGAHSARLVIVESPAKARTVGRFLGSDYDVRASVGHVRDLLRSRLSVDVEHDFAPTYRVPDEKREVVKGLKQAAAEAREIFLATDPDREGEAIAWHLVEAAQIPHDRTRRVVFHEITKSAVSEAFAHSRDIDMCLVDAQQARRILDRLVGYEVSPLLWDRVKSRLSAGRVQSVALRLIVEREREIAAFIPVEYWSLDAELAQQSTRGNRTRPSFLARLIRIRGEEADLKNRADAEAVVADLEGAVYVVSGVKRGERRRRPNPPFTTSTLQQDAAQRLGMTAARTMRLAQELYEGIDMGDGEGPAGLITYMRTDSVNVAQEAQAEARALIAEQYGPDYLPPEPNVYRSRAKNAQEAHEAIRPTSSRRLPVRVRERLSRDQHRLYELIWQRFIASQMAAAIYDTMTVDVEAGPPGLPARPYLFRARGSKLRFPGFLVVYSGGSSGPENGGQVTEATDAVTAPAGSVADRRANETSQRVGDSTPTREELAEQEILPDLTQGEELDLLRLLPEQHFTQPPPRYTEATLVKALEENGIGRPSTYAAIISTVLDRGYVTREDRKLLPTELGYTVNDLLVKYFDTVFDVGFTAGMEEHLDSIARGQEQMVPVLRDFYNFFQPQVEHAERTMEKVVVAPEKTGELCPQCGGDLLIKNGRYGRFIGCSNYPACNYTSPLVSKIGVVCPKDGGEIVERRSRKGRLFYGCANYPACDFTSWKRPLPQRCPNCGGLLVAANKTSAECTQCGARVPVEAGK